jgi:hypothetical protein
LPTAIADLVFFDLLFKFFAEIVCQAEYFGKFVRGYHV